MDLTSLLNTNAAGLATEGESLSHEARNIEAKSEMEAIHIPPATTAGSTARHSIAATPPLEQTSPRKLNEPRTGNRNRTPWDAGGYSLPRALDARQVMRYSPGAVALSAASTSPFGDSSSPQEAFDLGYSSPKSGSPRHLFSDSRSSLSSLHTVSSSINSLSHSRLSSLSTVSETQPLTALITDFSPLEAQLPDPPVTCYTLPHMQQCSVFSHATDKIVDFQSDSPTPVRSRHSQTYEDSPERSPASPDRAQSPSDAVLIPRLANDSERFSPDPGNTRLRSSPPYSRSHSRNNYLQRSNSLTRRHKRAASAPDFPSIGAATFDPHFPTFGPIPEPTPSPSQHSDGNMMDREISMSISPTVEAMSNASPGALSMEHGSSSGPTPAMTNLVTGESGSSLGQLATEVAEESFVDFETASACMYRGDCQTGSQLRKAISHIFGRNKLCTRMIPTGVWVHYCRKHYQRTRYRNGGEYPQRQIGLVQEQVKRVQAWSDSNTRRGQGPILKDWSLSVRKREQMRLDSKLAANGKKRPFQEEGEGEDEEGFDEDRSDMSGTAVPDWVISRIGDGYSTAEILAVVDRLKADIDQGRLQQIPDIEILPNIATENRNDDAKKGFAKRRTTGSRSNVGGSGASPGAGHRRSQSVNAVGLLQDSATATRRRNQSNNLVMPPRTLHNSDLQLPLEKRQRIAGQKIDRFGHSCSNSESFEALESLALLPANGNTLSRPSLGGRVQLAHRPAFGEIRESRAEVHDYRLVDRARFEALPGDAGETSQQQQQAVAAPGANLYERGRGYGSSTGQSGPYGYGSCYEYERQQRGPSPTRYGMLPAPNPLRQGSSSVAQRLEASSYALNSATTRRVNTHQRSQSEAMFHHHIPSPHHSRPTSSSGFPSLQRAPLALGTSIGDGFGQAAAAGKAASPHKFRKLEQAGYSTYQSQSYGQASRFDDERSGSLGGQQPYGYTNETESYERYESVQLPPLQSLSQFHVHQRLISPVAGGGVEVDRKFGTATEYSQAARHARHQSSPAVPRLFPTPMEVGTARHLPEMGKQMSPGS